MEEVISDLSVGQIITYIVVIVHAIAVIFVNTTKTPEKSPLYRVIEFLAGIIHTNKVKEKP